MKRYLLAAALLASPALAQKPVSISDRDRQAGAEAHRKILEEFGGAYTGPGAAFVSRVAKSVAVQSGIADSGNQCTVTLLDSTVVNAFALPGCYVYVTRGLLAIANDEAEIASALGHEIGHVAARHSQKRQNRQTLSGIGSVVASVLFGQAAGQLANYAGQRTVLAFSRDQEYQADKLGIRYMAGAGYDPYGSPDMLRALDEDSELQTALKGKTKADMTPAWARTHPLTRDRIARAATEARAIGGSQRQRGTGAYYAAVDGMLYGDSPREGIVGDDGSFTHPVEKLRFQAPPDAQVMNGRDAVTITTADGGQAQFGAGVVPRSARLEDYALTVARQLLGNGNARLGEPERTRVNGIDTVVLPARAQTQSGTRDIQIAAYRWGESRAFHLVTIAPPGRPDRFNGLIGSLRRLSDAEAAAVRPRVIQVVTVRAGDTVESLSRRMTFSTMQAQRFAALNDLEPGRPLTPGQQVKLVVFGR